MKLFFVISIDTCDDGFVTVGLAHDPSGKEFAGFVTNHPWHENRGGHFHFAAGAWALGQLIDLDHPRGMVA